MKARKSPEGPWTLLAALVLVAVWTGPQTVHAYPNLTTLTITILPDMPKGDYVNARDGGLGFRFTPNPDPRHEMMPGRLGDDERETATRNVFLFGDTALSRPNSGGTQWVVNTMYCTMDNNADDGIEGGFNYPQAGKPAEQWVPWTPAEVAYNTSKQGIVGLWPTAPFKDPVTGRTYLWFGKVLEHPGKGFDGVGMGFCEVLSLTEPATRIRHRPGQAEDFLMFLNITDGKTTEGLYGSMSVVSKGFLYAYDWSGSNWGRVTVARAPVEAEAFKSRPDWRFWDGSQWVANASMAKPIMQLGGQGTIAWNEYLDCWLYTHMEYLGKRMVMRLADNPWGPWSDPFYIYTATPGPKGETPYSGYAIEMLQKEKGRIQYTAYSIPDSSSWTGGRIAMVRVRFN